MRKNCGATHRALKMPTMATSRTAASARGSSSSKKVHGMTTLQNYFSASLTKKMKPNNKQETTKSSASEGAPNRRGKRERQSQNMGSSKTPLRLLNEKNENSRDKKRTKTKHSSSTSPAEPEPNNGGNRIGLFRIGSVENDSSLSLTASKKDAYILQEGNVLGRNVSNARRSSSGSGTTKLDLGIGADALGVSRKQLKIIKVQPDSVTIHQGETPNQVGLYRYDKEKKRMSHEIDYVGADGTATLFPGDVVEFDTYNRGVERLLDPQHVFRVVVVTDTVNLEEDSESAIMVPPNDKAASSSEKKQTAFADQVSAMEIDSTVNKSADAMEPDVFVECQSTPAGDSFHTARADSQSTASIPSSTKQSSTEMARHSSSPVDKTPNDHAKKPTTQETVYSELTAASGLKSRDTPSAASIPAPESGGTVKFAPKKSEEKNSQASKATEEEEDAKMAASKTPDGDTAMADAQELEAEVSPATLFATRGGTAVVRTPVVGDRFRAVYDRQNDIPDNFLGFAQPAW